MNTGLVVTSDIYTDADKLYTYLKGYFTGAKLVRAQNALSLARTLHFGQTRKSGKPYILHPLTMLSHAVSMGIVLEALYEALALHDTIEDCGIDIDTLSTSYPAGKAISLPARKAIKLVSVDKWAKSQDRVGYYDKYYEAISTDLIASLTKLIDRANNVSTMAGVFKPEKLKEYYDETVTYILPLLRKIKTQYPEYGDVLFILKYHICSVLNVVGYASTVLDEAPNHWFTPTIWESATQVAQMQGVSPEQYMRQALEEKLARDVSK